MKNILAALLMLGPSALLSNALAQERLNQIQVIGSHNSYKKAIEPALLQYLMKGDSTKRLNSLQYEHITIPEQLKMGLRNLEIDVYPDSKGGKYAKPKGLEMVKAEQAFDPKGLMQKPGFKVLHIPDIDFRSSAPTFEICLKQLHDWSVANPGHIPVFITLEPKDGETNHLGTTPEPFTEQLFNELDAAIRKHLGADRLITPDMVRGNYNTLEAAVLAGNWPEMKQAKGKFLFILDNTGKNRDMYIKGHPSLKGRVLFVNAEPGTPEAAALLRNNPEDSSIPKLVKKGYIVRTRADADTREARRNDYTHFRMAEKSGAQIITTDYYKPSSFFPSSYQVQFNDGTYVRPNPVILDEKIND
ncbi:phosphatidylinositol-specific phospholipase C1-like protein [Desertivirga brevis]|uniref:phosphatidylinositol-specific phospholipase C1-like protein n=1 Tax=Desertivirga brevis TaxID=2810310 RepID=UPI001A95F86E|nr:phosphatidylinositol-specific phospholipase C1-like protein [Pedobacter sp. SYSU D00873]